MEGGLVHEDGVGEEVVHLDEFAHEGVEEADDAEHGFSGDAELRFAAGEGEDLIGDLLLGDGARAGEVPPVAVGCGRGGEGEDDGAYVGDVDVFVGDVDGADHVGGSSFGCGLKEGVEEAGFDVGAVEVGEAEDGALDLSFVMGFEEDLLLGFAHLAFEGLGFARV